MSQLKIYTNANHEIKALYYTDDKTLTEHVVDREALFGNHTDPYILGYTYEEMKDEGGAITGCVCAPYMDLGYLSVAEQAVKESTGYPAIIVNHSTLADLIAYHKKAVGNVASKLMVAGVMIGNDKYSLTTYDQINITNLYNQVMTGAKVVAWHADGQMCKIMTAEEMTQLGQLSMAYVTYHTTRANMLARMIDECKTKRQVLAINYQTPLDSTRAAAFETIMTTMGISEDVRKYCDASVAAAGDVEGEIYSTQGSNIDPTLYDTQSFMKLDEMSATTDNKTDITTFKIPGKFVDRDKVSAEKPETNINAVFNKMTITDNVIKSDYSSDFVLQYIYDAESDSSYLKVDMSVANVVSCLLPVGALYNELTDKVNAAQTVYLIKTATMQMATTDYSKVQDALGWVKPVDPANEEE